MIKSFKLSTFIHPNSHVSVGTELMLKHYLCYWDNKKNRYFLKFYFGTSSYSFDSLATSESLSIPPPLTLSLSSLSYCKIILYLFFFSLSLSSFLSLFSLLLSFSYFLSLFLLFPLSSLPLFLPVPCMCMWCGCCSKSVIVIACNPFSQVDSFSCLEPVLSPSLAIFTKLLR